MEEALQSIRELFAQFPTHVILGGLIVVFVLGFVKIFTKLIPGEESKFAKVMKVLYPILALAISFGVTSLYCKYGPTGERILGEDHSAWTSAYIMLSLSVFGCSQSLYPIYEKLGGRALLKAIISGFKGKSKDADAVLAVVEKVLVLTPEQEQAIKAQAKRDL